MAGMSRNDSTQAMKSILSAYADDGGDDAGASSDEGGVDNISDEEEEDAQRKVSPGRANLFGSPEKRDSDDQLPTSQKKVKAQRKAISRLVSYGPDDVDDDDDDDDDANVEEESNAESEEGEENGQGIVNYDLSYDQADLSGSMPQTVPETGDDGDVRIPPEPPGKCSKSLQEKIKKMVEKVFDEGLNLSNSIQNKKMYRNPSIYEKLVEFIGIDEKGTNYPAELYNPAIWGEQSYYDELAKLQKIEMDKREKDKKDRTKVEFVSGTKKTMDGHGEQRRKSKWDTQPPVVGAGKPLSKPQLLTSTALNPPVVSATGHKTTVISAIGSIKKSK